jgi:hypothetical protein
VTLLVTVGTVRISALIGPMFHVAHVALFFLGTPALANLLVLRQPRGFVRWYWAVPACTFCSRSGWCCCNMESAKRSMDSTGQVSI